MRRDEQGMVSILGLCLLFVMLLFGMTLMYAAGNCMETERNFQEEAQLRLAAESGMEEAALQVEKEDAADLDRVGAFPNADCIYEAEVFPGIHVMTYASRRENRLELLARAKRFDAVSRRTSCRSVHGCMEKKGEHYVWYGWLP